MAHKSLSLSFVTLFVLYVFGIVDRNNAPQMYPQASLHVPLSLHVAIFMYKWAPAVFISFNKLYLTMIKNHLEV